MGGGNPIVASLIGEITFKNRRRGIRIVYSLKKKKYGDTLIGEIGSTLKFYDKGAPAEAGQQSLKKCGLGGGTLTTRNCAVTVIGIGVFHSGV